jgi:hypothetical protein
VRYGFLFTLALEAKEEVEPLVALELVKLVLEPAVLLGMSIWIKTKAIQMRVYSSNQQFSDVTQDTLMEIKKLHSPANLSFEATSLVRFLETRLAVDVCV